MPMKDYSQRDIEGCWTLRSWRILYDDDRAASEPFGKEPEGLLLYSADGWMSATVCRPDRPGFPAGSSPRTLGDTPVAEAFRSYFHYAGTYRIDDGCVIHTVYYSLNPDFVGTEQSRHLRIDGRLLTLTGFDRAGDSERRHELVWQRCAVAGRDGSE